MSHARTSRAGGWIRSARLAMSLFGVLVGLAGPGNLPAQEVGEPAAASSPAAQPAPTAASPVLPATTATRTSEARIPAAAASATQQGAGTTGAAVGTSPRGAPAVLPSGRSEDATLAVRIAIGLTLLAVLPGLLICMTSFLRIIVVLSMLRQAIGMPETPPNPALIGLALFLTLFTMQPVMKDVSRDAFEPFMAGRIDATQAYQAATRPLRGFMVRQTREQDLALMIELSKAERPATIEDVSLVQLVPAFVLSELRAAFEIGFVIFLPFLLIDLIVSSILMTLGMMMMPPVTVSLPLKVLMFVLVDGWALVLKGLVGSFH